MMYGHANVLLASIPLAVLGAAGGGPRRIVITARGSDELRRLHAELVLLERYDSTRSSMWDDYGSGQRYGELMRRRRKIDALAAGGDWPIVAPTSDELADAFERVGRRRLRRAELESEKYGSRGVRLTRDAWQRIARTYGRPA